LGRNIVDTADDEDKDEVEDRAARTNEKKMKEGRWVEKEDKEAERERKQAEEERQKEEKERQKVEKERQKEEKERQKVEKERQKEETKRQKEEKEHQKEEEKRLKEEEKHQKAAKVTAKVQESRELTIPMNNDVMDVDHHDMNEPDATASDGEGLSTGLGLMSVSPRRAMTPPQQTAGQKRSPSMAHSTLHLIFH
jgi:hypothetical protein